VKYPKHITYRGRAKHCVVLTVGTTLSGSFRPAANTTSLSAPMRCAGFGVSIRCPAFRPWRLSC